MTPPTFNPNVTVNFFVNLYLITEREKEQHTSIAKIKMPQLTILAYVCP